MVFIEIFLLKPNETSETVYVYLPDNHSQCTMQNTITNTQLHARIMLQSSATRGATWQLPLLESTPVAIRTARQCR
jgi:hypothetical protein